MNVCPLCNGLVDEFKITCVKCNGVMEDQGRLTDYLDDYSAYMDIDQMKLFDGFEQSLEKHQCIHMLFCSRCNDEKLYPVKE